MKIADMTKEESILSLIKAMPFLRIGYGSDGWDIYSVPQSRSIYSGLDADELLKVLEDIWIMEGREG